MVKNRLVKSLKHRQELAKSRPLPKNSRFSSKAAHFNHHQHTGKRLPIHYTSYAALFFIIALAALIVFFVRDQIVQAGGPTQTQSGSIQVAGIVPGAAPSVAATINSPPTGTHTNSSIIVISGDCTSGFIVEIYRNSSFTGSILCDSTNQYSLAITLTPGQNNVIARIRNNASVYGPDSNQVIISYDQPQTVSQPAKQSTLPLLLYTKPVQEGVYSGNPSEIEYTIDGGLPTYAVAINWGDSTKVVDVQSINKPGSYKLTHQYKQTGQYQATLSATDQVQDHATISTILIVNAKTNNSYSVTNLCNVLGSSSCNVPENTLVLNVNKFWPALIIAGAMTFSFWMGERVIYSRLGKIRHT